jgi:tetratricopeptide (TPR) repeat protein
MAAKRGSSMSSAAFANRVSARFHMAWIALAIAAVTGVGEVRVAAAPPDLHDLMEGRGKGVSFPVSCRDDVQLRFDAALAALHSFWYGQALKEFTAIVESNPDCAMAHWGVAMSVWNQLWAPPRPDNLKKGREAIEKARTVGEKSRREQDYIDALAAFYADFEKRDHRTRVLAYTGKMEQVARDYPEDREATIFHALALLASADPLDKTYANQIKAGAMLEKIMAETPQHPAVSHYIIHAYDYPALVDRALAAAQIYAACVTIVPHAIHMPSHTYVLLGRWRDAIAANIAGQAAEKERGSPEDRIHDLDYLVYAYLQLGEDAKAKEVFDLALQIENDLAARKHDTGLRSRPFGIAAMEARWAMERQDWAGAAGLPVRADPRYPFVEAVSRFARAVGLARSGRPGEAQAEIDRLGALQKTLADAKNLYWARQVDIERQTAAAWSARALGRNEEALALMEAGAKAEETSETHDTLSPGPVGMTAHEALGALLVELGRPADAVRAFEASLRTSKNRLQSYAGAARAAAAAGDAADARAYFVKVLALADGSDTARPEIAAAKAYVDGVGK